MKLEIEITEEEIRKAIEGKVRQTISNQISYYGTDLFIKELVQKHWKESVETFVKEAVCDSAVMRKKIAEEIQRKIRSQLTAAMKAAE